MLWRMHGCYQPEESKKQQERFCNATGRGPTDKNWYQPALRALPNVKYITENDHWWSYMQHGPKAECWCGHQVDKVPFVTAKGEHVSDWVDMLLYWDDHSHLIGGGHGVLWSYNQKQTKYFTWQACAHDWHETSPRMFSHVVTCSKCSASYEYDSS